MLRKRRVETYDTAPGITEARRRFGGLDLPAALAAMVAGLGTAVVLAGVASAIGSYGYDRGTGTSTLSNAAVITGMVVLFLSFLVGGWVAGRMARYDGAANGVLSAVLFLALAVGLTALGNWLDTKYNFLGHVNLPNWFTGPDTQARVVSAVVGIVVVLVAAAVGGGIGARYHRHADRVIAVAPPLGETLVTGDADVDLERSHVAAERSDEAPRHARH